MLAVFPGQGGVPEYDGGKADEPIKGGFSEFPAQRILKIICSVLALAIHIPMA